MRRPAVAILLVGTFLLTLVLIAGAGLGYSDGYAGGSGAIPERFRDCQGQEFCKFKPSYCGTCHGQSDDMWRQEGSNPTPQERVKVRFSVNGDEEAGTTDGLWEYRLDGVYTIRISLEDNGPEPKRDPGTWASGGFNLNASAGTLTNVDDNVRITGGVFQHQGSKNPAAVYENGQQYGSPEEDESQWAGEATHTRQGSDRRDWTVRWRAPSASEDPFGMAFVMTAMLPNGDGFDSCVYNNCNQSQGYAPQSQWDWYAFMIPRRIMCQADFYDSFKECQDAVLDFLLPPSPPLAGTNTTTPATQQTRGTPAPPTTTFLFALAAIAWAVRRRPGNAVKATV